MALPVDYDTVPVRGKFVYLDGTPATGRVTFTGKILAISDSTDTIIIPNTIVANLDANGAFEVSIPATDDPDILPNGWTYTVREELISGGGRVYDIEVPLAAAGDGIDLSEIAPVTPAHGDPTAFVTLEAFESHTHEGGGGGGEVAWGDITDKPSVFPPDAHTHTKTEVGLANVDNTSDADKPVSTAQQTALDGKLSLSRTFATEPASSEMLRTNFTFGIDSTSPDVEQFRVDNVNVCWRNEVGFLRGTPAPFYKDDAVVRGRARSDLSTHQGGYIELEDSSAQKLHARRWTDGALIRGNGTGTIVCADVLVLGPVDAVPAGTPTGTVIIRTA